MLFRVRSAGHWRVTLFALAVLAAPAVARAHTIVFPQLVTGGGYISTVTLVNTNYSVPVVGELLIYNQNGTPRVTVIEGRGAASRFDVTIPPGGTVVLTTTEVGGSAVSGMAKFSSDYTTGGVVRFQFSGGQVGVLNTPFQPFATLVLNTSDGNDTGVAICNPGLDSLNLRLAYVDETGKTVETVDPPDLNPLPSNGQVAKFATQFGFTQVANRSKGSIQIQTKGTGVFSAFALLLRDGMLSSTAVVPGVSGKSTIEELSAGYTGTWRNTTFNSEGNANLTLGYDDTSLLAVINLELTGNVFGSTAPPATTLVGPLKLTGLNATGTSPVFGPMTLTLTIDGDWTFTADNVTSGTIATFRITGTARPDKITGNYTVTFRGGGSASGTVTMNTTGR